MLNKAMVIGNLTKKPELKKTKNDVSVASFSVATNSKYKDSDGNLQEEVQFHNIVVWKKLAELCCEYLDKGSKIYVEGTLKTRSWDKEGVTMYTTEIHAREVEFLTPKSESSKPKEEAQPDAPSFV